MTDKAYGMIGLAKRAGKLITGEEKVLESVRSGKARLVILAGDASDNTSKKFNDNCSYYRTDIVVYGTKEMLGHAVMSLTDKNFADSIKKLLF